MTREEADKVVATSRVRRTPKARHPYTATAKGHGTYGWGHDPAEARGKLLENLVAYG